MPECKEKVSKRFFFLKGQPLTQRKSSHSDLLSLKICVSTHSVQNDKVTAQTAPMSAGPNATTYARTKPTMYLLYQLTQRFQTDWKPGTKPGIVSGTVANTEQNIIKTF